MKANNFKLLFVSILLILSLTLTTGCGLLVRVTQTPDATTSPTSAPTTEVTNTNITPTAKVTLPFATSSAQPLPNIADVVAKVKPSVVAINVKATVTMIDFFGRQIQQEEEGAGSGWIITQDGLIVTNTHVVQGATSVLVTLDDGRNLPVDIKNIKTDILTDLAVMKVDATGLPALTMGDSTKLREGEWVVAIGNSLGEGIRVTQGIISRKDASLQDETGQMLTGLIETDAVINPGNSGGPLVNLSGLVIGITNAKRVQTGVEGVGYAISTHEASPIIQDLINIGYIVRPYLGVGTETVESSAYARWFGLKVNSGVRITSVGVGSPAGKAGLQEDDVIVKFDGQDIIDAQQLVDAIHRSKVGQTVELVFWRGSEQKTINVTLAETPKPQ